MIFSPVDIQIIFFFLFLANLIMALLLIFYGISTQFDKMLVYYISGKIMQLIGIAIISLNDIPGSYFMFALGGSFTFLGLFFESYCLIFVGMNPSKKFSHLYFTTISFLIIIFLSLPLFSVLPSLMKIVHPIISFILLASVGIALLLYNNDTKLKKSLGIFFLAMTFPHLLLFINIFLQKNNYFFIEPSLTLVVFFSFSAIQIIISTMSYLLMYSEKEYRALKEAATKDFLTGISNRREFMQLSAKLFNLMLRQKSHFSILMLDLDHFKSINDKFGHQTGDKVIKHFAKSVEPLIRRQDVFGRYGGEEFLIFLPGEAKNEALSIAERIRKSIEEGGIINTIIPKYTVSIGCSSVIPDEKIDLEKVIDIADNALYEAKQNGRNRVVAEVLKP